MHLCHSLKSLTLEWNPALFKLKKKNFKDSTYSKDFGNSQN